MEPDSTAAEGAIAYSLTKTVMDPFCGTGSLIID
jgi:hypothetical protein